MTCTPESPPIYRLDKKIIVINFFSCVCLIFLRGHLDTSENKKSNVTFLCYKIMFSKKKFRKIFEGRRKLA